LIGARPFSILRSEDLVKTQAWILFAA